MKYIIDSKKNVSHSNSHCIFYLQAGGGMGLSIVAAKGVGKDKLGIYVKAVVDNGAAHHDGKLKLFKLDQI